MRRGCRKWAVGFAAAGLLLGCGRDPSPPAGTGAREAALEFFEALSQKEWSRAYALLHPQSRGRHSLEQFRRLAQNYRGGLGFEPSAVNVRACEEQGDQAIAHVAWTGRTLSRQRNYRDAVQLLRDHGEWGVVLPAQFGHPRRAK
jgi:hypothetical protein